MTYLAAILIQLAVVIAITSPMVRWFVRECFRHRMVVQIIDGQAVARRRRVLSFD